VGLTGWYAPAADLHRSPFGGRTSEYFSEDPYLSGHIAGSIVSGMTSKGILCTIKHVALNENETQRQSLFTYVSEQAAREIYFKVFQIVLQEYNCGVIMTSYNNIGEVHSDANYAFLQQLLRDEWGWEGYQTTDAVTPMNNFFSMDTMLRAGGNLLLSNVTEESGVMNNGTGNCAVSGTYDADRNQVVLADGSVSYTQWAALRNAARQILYVEANSKQSTNGYDLTTYASAGIALPEARQASFYEASVDCGIEGADVAYKVTAGQLPEGMSLEVVTAGSGNQSGGLDGFGASGGMSASQGTLTGAVVKGTPLTTGHYEFTICATGDGWVTAETTYSLDVSSAIVLELYSDSAAGAEYLASVSLENAAEFNEGVVYTAEGLPEGLTLSEDGIIEGTPVVPGTYVVTITAAGTSSTMNFMHQTIYSTTTYTSPVVMEITGEGGTAVSISSIMTTDAGYVVYFSDGTSTTIAG